MKIEDFEIDKTIINGIIEEEIEELTELILKEKFPDDSYIDTDKLFSKLNSVLTNFFNKLKEEIDENIHFCDFYIDTECEILDVLSLPYEFIEKQTGIYYDTDTVIPYLACENIIQDFIIKMHNS